MLCITAPAANRSLVDMSGSSYSAACSSHPADIDVLPQVSLYSCSLKGLLLDTVHRTISSILAALRLYIFSAR